MDTAADKHIPFTTSRGHGKQRRNRGVAEHGKRSSRTADNGARNEHDTQLEPAEPAEPDRNLRNIPFTTEHGLQGRVGPVMPRPSSQYGQRPQTRSRSKRMSPVHDDDHAGSAKRAKRGVPSSEMLGSVGVLSNDSKPQWSPSYSPAPSTSDYSVPAAFLSRKRSRSLNVLSPPSSGLCPGRNGATVRQISKPGS